jgi:hypothetical protein
LAKVFLGESSQPPFHPVVVHPRQGKEPLLDNHPLSTRERVLLELVVGQRRIIDKLPKTSGASCALLWKRAWVIHAGTCKSETTGSNDKKWHCLS